MTRIKPNDIVTPENSIVEDSPLTASQSGLEKPDVEKIFYTILGKQDDLDEDGNPILNSEDEDGNSESVEERALAQIVIVNGSKKYKVKRYANGQLYDPMGITNRNNQRRNDRIRSTTYGWTIVSKPCFDLYLAFLRTKNKAHLLRAEREG